MNKIEIRKMNNNDISQVQTLIEQLNEIFPTEHDISKYSLANTFNEMEKDNDIYLNYVAISESRIVGFISSIVYKTFFHNKGTLLINELIVDKEYRGRSIGEKLLQKMIDIASRSKLNEIEVGTTFENTKAIEFYKKNGLKDESILLGKELNN